MQEYKGGEGERRGRTQACFYSAAHLSLRRIQGEPAGHRLPGDGGLRSVDNAKLAATTIRRACSGRVQLVDEAPARDQD